MRRIAITVTVWMLAASLGIAARASRLAGDGSRGPFAYRTQAEQQLAVPITRRPFVLWFGDSTLAGFGSSPMAAAQEALAPTGAEVHPLALRGGDVFSHYYLMGPALRLAPDLIVLVANLAQLGPNRTGRGFRDLSSMVPWDEVPRAAWLPLGDDASSAGFLVAAKLLLSPVLEPYTLPTAALRAGVAPRLVRAPATDERVMLDALYRMPLSPEAPLVRMLGATVAMARRHDVPIMVYVTPVPWERLEGNGVWPPGFGAAQVNAVRRAVEDAGGTFVDLHRALRDDLIADYEGHLRPGGATELGRLLAARIAPLLPAGAPDGHVEAPAE